MEIRAKTLVFFLILLLLAGCAKHTEIWEKNGGDQQLFEIDSRECDYIANQVALQQSETGNRADPEILSTAYSKCIEAKGWRKKAPTVAVEQEEKPDTVQQIAEAINATTVKGFGQAITVPDTYSLSAQKRLQSGPTTIEQFSWKGSDGSFLNILFQKNSLTTFKRIPYPVSEPFRLYTAGQGEKTLERLQWATFFRQAGPGWVMVTGAYYYVNRKERVIIVITKPLVGPSGIVAEKAVLAENQYSEIDEFSHQWQTWLNQQFTEGPGILTQLKKVLRLNPEPSL